MEWKTLLNTDRPRISTSQGDHRAQFERDFDRCVFSTPVKRLQDKAQVFPLEPHDAIRTRLTHSLEVSSVARGLGIAIAQWLLEGDKKKIDSGMDRQIEAIAATCGLIHDLGNPPFGHAGEDAIRGWFQDKIKKEKLQEFFGDYENSDQLVQDFLKFEGNAQTLRLVSKLQILADFQGLNLTYGTLSASCKYIAPSHEAGDEQKHECKKPGYFASENKLVAEIQKRTGTGNARNPITYLVEAADDIVYSVADVEDGVKKGVLSWDDLKSELSNANDDEVNGTLETKDHILKAGKDEVPNNLPDDIHASAFRTAAIGVMVRSAIDVFKAQYGSIMDGTYHGELVEEGKAKKLVKLLKDIGKKEVYCTPQTLKLELMGRHIITDLLDLFWEGAEKLPLDRPPETIDFSGKLGALLSNSYRRVFYHFVKEDQGLPENYHRLQLVTDYICGMTDSFAKRLHAELTNAQG